MHDGRLHRVTWLRTHQNVIGRSFFSCAHDQRVQEKQNKLVQTLRLNHGTTNIHSTEEETEMVHSESMDTEKSIESLGIQLAPEVHQTKTKHVPGCPHTHDNLHDFFRQPHWHTHDLLHDAFQHAFLQHHHHHFNNLFPDLRLGDRQDQVNNAHLSRPRSSAPCTPVKHCNTNCLARE